MNTLWAPWRLEYILSNKESGCFLCEASQAHDDQKNLILCRRRTCFCLLNRYPYNNGHLLIAPYEHVAGLAGLNDEVMLGLMTLTRDAQAVLQKQMSPHGFNIGANLGQVAGAGVPGHFHIHVVPRWTGDTNFMSAVSETKVIPQSLAELWGQLEGRFD